MCKLIYDVCVYLSVKDLDNLKIDDVEGSLASERCDELSDDVYIKSLVLAKGESSIMFCHHYFLVMML